MLHNGGGGGGVWNSAPGGGGGVVRGNCASSASNGTVTPPNRYATFPGGKGRSNAPKKKFNPKRLNLFALGSSKTPTSASAKKKKAKVGTGRASAEAIHLRLKAHSNSAKQKLESLSQPLPDSTSWTPHIGNGKGTRRSSTLPIGKRIKQTKADLTAVATELAKAAQEGTITDGGNVPEAGVAEPVPGGSEHYESMSMESVLTEPVSMSTSMDSATMEFTTMLPEPASMEPASMKSTSKSKEKTRKSRRHPRPRIALFASMFKSKQSRLSKGTRDEGQGKVPETQEPDPLPLASGRNESASMEPTSMETSSKEKKPRKPRRRRRPKLAIFSSKKVTSRRPNLSLTNFWKHLISVKRKTIDLEAREACSAAVIKDMEKLEKVTLIRYDSLKNLNMSGQLERKEWVMEDFEDQILTLQERIGEKTSALNIERGELRRGRRSSCCSFCAAGP